MSTNPKSAPAKAPLDEELDRERLEPGLNTGGKGEAGADPAPRDGGNSNT